MTDSNGLDQFLTGSRQAAVPATDDGTVSAKFEALLTELDIPWKVDQDGDYWLTSDVGEFVAAVVSGTVVISQNIGDTSSKTKKNADFYWLGLDLNASDGTGGASNALLTIAGQEKMMIISAIEAEDLNKQVLAFVLKSCFKLSRAWDQALEAV